MSLERQGRVADTITIHEALLSTRGVISGKATLTFFRGFGALIVTASVFPVSIQ